MEKAIYLLSLLSDKQENKLWKDYTTYCNNTIEPKLKKVNNIISSGYYPYYSITYKWLKEYRFKLLNKKRQYNFIINNAYKYMNL